MKIFILVIFIIAVLLLSLIPFRQEYPYTGLHISIALIFIYELIKEELK